MSRIDALQVIPAAGPALTPSQKRFNTLIRQIEQARQALASWQEGIAAYRRSHAEVVKPLQEQVTAGHRQWVLTLGTALGQRHWTRAERETLRDLLCEEAGALLEDNPDDLEIKALFDQHSEVDFDTEQREVALAMKGMAEAMTGLDLGDDEGIDSDEDLFKRMEQGMREHAAQQEARRDAKAASHQHKSKTAAQKRREAEAQQVTQSVREVYRKLASALHPDRETDERQREVKTALMQRVNQAYESNDLLALLELQLEIEQIDASHIANVGEQRLRHYNKVLSDQLSDLKAELEHAEMAFCMEFDVEPGWNFNPRKLGQVLEQERREWRVALNEQQRELRMLGGDVPQAKRWLKRVRKERREEEEEFDLW
jgi:hypothetical protein